MMDERDTVRRAPHTAATSRIRDPRFALVALFTVAAACYLNVTGHAFVSDDYPLILEHPYTRDLAHLPDIFSAGHCRGTGAYRPLVTLSFALNYSVCGTRPAGYHAINILFHALNTCLLYLVARRLFSPIAACIGALLFAVHPVHTEAVTWISGRAELLAAAFFLGAWLLYLRATAVERTRPVSYAASLLLFFAALLSKENALMLPLVLFFSDVYRGSRGDETDRGWRSLARNGLRRYPAYAAVILGYLLFRGLLYHAPLVPGVEHMPFLDNPLTVADTLPRLYTATAVIGRYVKLALWPRTLSCDYSFNAIPVVHSPWHTGVLLSVALLLVAFVAAVQSWRRGGALWFGIVFFFVMLAPVTNIAAVIGTIMAERLLYLPSAGACLAAGVLCAPCFASSPREKRRTSPRHAVLLGLGVVVILAGLRTWLRNRDWQDELTLWRSAVRNVPESAKAHYNVGYALLKRGEAEAAEKALMNALRIRPGYGEALVNLGAVLMQKGELDDAIAVYRRALAAQIVDPGLNINLGVALAAKGRWAEAESAFRQAVTIDARNAVACYNLGLCLAAQGRRDEALPHYQRAVALQPDYAEAWNSLGVAYAKLGRQEAAVQSLRRALDLRPDFPEARRSLQSLVDADDEATPANRVRSQD